MASGPLDARQDYRQAFRIRTLELRLLELFGEGKLSGTTHTCIGQEDVALGVIGALRSGHDVVFSNHRCHGHFLAYGGPMAGLVAEIMGRATGVCAGRGGSQHLCWQHFHSNGVQGGIVPQACGLALAAKLKASDQVVCAFVGDGTLGEGVVYESLNMASLWRLPILFVVEDNGYAQTTPKDAALAGSIGDRFASFGIAVAHVRSGDLAAIRQASATAVAKLRSGEGPCAIVAQTYRLAPHSKGDDHRDATEIAAAWERDPLRSLAAWVPAQVVAEVENEVRAEVEGAIAQALQAATRAEGAEAIGQVMASRFEVPALPAGARVIDRINAGLHTAFAHDPGVFLIGEDLLDPYGGAFKASRGLSTAYRDRVLSTPISEAGLVGIASGAALGGLHPVAEIMFGDFCSLIVDQVLNHAAKFRYMYNGQVRVPLVIRTPMGGRRGYGPTHSQSIEKLFFGMPGLRTVALTEYWDPAATLLTCLSQEDPVLLVENKVAYAHGLGHAPAGYRLLAPSSPLGPVRLVPATGTADCTILAYGGMDREAAAAAQRLRDEEIQVEILIPQQVAPCDAFMGELEASVRATSRLVVCEEGTAPWGFGAEVLARLTENGVAPLRARRVAAKPQPIPTSKDMERDTLPDESAVFASVCELLIGPTAT